MKTNSKNSTFRKSTLCEFTLASIANNTVKEFADNATLHDWLEAEDGLTGYPDSLFVDDENNSHLPGVDLRNCVEYRRKLSGEWNSALAVSFLDGLRWTLSYLGESAAFRFTNNRENKKLVLSKRTELREIWKKALSYDHNIDVPYVTQIATVLTTSDTEPSKTSSSGDITLQFWKPLVPLMESSTRLRGEVTELHIPIDWRRTLLTPHFAMGFIDGCLRE